jgi:ABC-type transporter Mla subunit MlaD
MQSKTDDSSDVRSEMDALQEDNSRLWELVANLSAVASQNATVFKNAADAVAEAKPLADCTSTHPDLIKIVEHCSDLAQQIRERAKALEHIGNTLMAKSVEIETVLQREKWGKKSRPSTGR